MLETRRKLLKLGIIGGLSAASISAFMTDRKVQALRLTDGTPDLIKMKYGDSGATPPAGEAWLGVAADKNIYLKDDDGLVTQLNIVNLADLTSKDHSDLDNIGVDDHHAQIHASSHEDGGGDEIDVTDLSGLLADAQTPAAHASDHEDGGGDEIDVTDLSGLLADAQTPLGHHADHENGGGDEIDVEDLSGLLADAQTPLAHESSHISAGGDAFLSTDLLEAIVKRIQESTGPTTLTVGAVADGEYLKRDGATIVGDTPAGGGLDFWGQHLILFTAADFSHSEASGGTGTVEGLTISLKTGATTGQYYARSFYLRGNDERSTSTIFWYRLFELNPAFEVIIQGDTSDGRDFTDMSLYIIIGVTDQSEIASNTRKQFGVVVIDGALYSCSSDGTTFSTLDLSTALSAEIDYRIKCKLNSVDDQVEVTVNGTAKTSKTTNIPTGNQANINNMCFINKLITNANEDKRWRTKAHKLMFDYVN